MRKFVLASHGYLAKGLKHTVELIMGEQSDISVLCGYTPECEDVKKAIARIAETDGEEELIVLTDVFGGSINNEFMHYLGEGKKYHLIAGMNVPIVIELLELGATDSVKEFLQKLNTKEHSYMQYCNLILEEKVADEDF